MIVPTIWCIVNITIILKRGKRSFVGVVNCWICIWLAQKHCIDLVYGVSLVANYSPARCSVFSISCKTVSNLRLLLGLYRKNLALALVLVWY